MLFVQFPQLVFQLFAGVEPELGNPDIGISGFRRLRTLVMAITSRTTVSSRVPCLAGNGDRRGAQFAPSYWPLLPGQFTQRFGIDLDDQITRLNASPVCRRIINGADHLDVAVLPTHLDAQPTEFARSGFLKGV